MEIASTCCGAETEAGSARRIGEARAGAEADTSPALLREQINDLYRFEIRRLRDRCRAGEFTTRELPARVVELRKRYLLLSIPIDRWGSEK